VTRSWAIDGIIVDWGAETHSIGERSGAFPKSPPFPYREDRRLKALTEGSVSWRNTSKEVPTRFWSKQDSAWEDLALDAAAGLGAVVFGFIIGFFTGGFVFVGPGVIAVIVMLVGGGWFRGAIPGSLLAKALAMNLFPWFLLMTFIDQSAAKHRPLAFLNYVSRRGHGSISATPLDRPMRPNCGASRPLALMPLVRVGTPYRSINDR
jgi:hypothetical protein